MPIDQRVMDIADGAVAHERLTRDDVEYLLGFDGYSPEAAYIGVRAREIAMVASEGVGTIHAQIGVDAHPCAMNCQYCAFAEVNAGVCADELELPIESIVRNAQLFDEHGVHLISLMSTASLSFARYLEMVCAVRAAVGDDMVILANTRDLTADEACALKDAGANAAYHAVRLGEGVYTGISPDRRRKTIEHIHDAGLALMTGVEPVWENADPALLAERLCELPGFRAYCIGACGLTSTAGTVLANKGMRTPRTGFVRYVGSISRLVCGYDARFGGAGGAIWVDAGTDPRVRSYDGSELIITQNIMRARRTLERDGWRVPSRPDMAWLS